MLAKWGRGSLIKENTHSRHCQRPRGMFQHFIRLFTRDAREPFEKVFHPCAAFNILKQRGHRNAGSTEDPRAADALGLALRPRTREPVDPLPMLRCADWRL